MIFWTCSAITLAAAIVATFFGDVRRAVLALWVAGLGAGGIYLSLGAEFLAIVQWIVSTLLTVSFIFYAIMIGEYGLSDERPLISRLVSALLPMGAGFAFVAVVWLGARHLPGVLGVPQNGIGDGQNLAGVGTTLVEEHWLSLILLALTLFLVIVGAGVVSRPEGHEK